ncbi:hypothetical protein MKX01_030240 [Papaver californicum]|nr:hypothetical protein MKX01_030240 [Papaver californicum]
MFTLYSSKVGFIAILAIFLSFCILSATTSAAYVSLANQFLIPHNAARKTIGAKPLVWDARLARYAQAYANLRRYDCALIHSSGPYGENIFWGGGWGWTPAQAVKMWVAEKSWFNPYSNTCNGEQCGHWTQIAWRDTKRLGCATVNCYGGRGVFTTCNYDPAGNYMGERPY